MDIDVLEFILEKSAMIFMNISHSGWLTEPYYTVSIQLRTLTNRIAPHNLTLL